MLLVTGAAGFIGSFLVEKLLSNGKEVIGIDNFDTYYSPEIKERNISEVLEHPGFRLIRGDILDLELLERVFSGFNISEVVHLAARAGVRASVEEPLIYSRVNVQGTMNLLEKCRLHGVKKFIFASTSAIYGMNKKLPFSESDRVDHPISPYAATKKSCELLCHTHHHLFGISIFCLRFFTVYGPRQRPDMAIHKFTHRILNDQEIHVYGDGTALRDFTYIDDILQGVTSAIERCKGYEIYNLGESQTIELRDLIKILEDIIGKKARIKHLPNQVGDLPATYADISKARKDLDYNPSFDIHQGISKFVEWYKSINQSTF